MKKLLFSTAVMLSFSLSVSAQLNDDEQEWSAGTFSLGTRNTLSMFNDDKAIGKGIGGQFRLQLKKRMNTEWYFDYITSKDGALTFRNDYHIGWSVLLYTRNNYSFDRLLQPYLIVGHCFDYSKVMAQQDRSNNASRLSMATQAGLGTHINITKRLDASLSGQYMLHFGKDIHTEVNKDGTIHIEKQDYTHADGHLLFTLSVNYKFCRFWGSQD